MVSQIKKEFPELERTKFGYAYSKFYKKNVKPSVDRIKDALLDIRVENAMIDTKTKELIIDKSNDRGFKFDKEGTKIVDI